MYKKKKYNIEEHLLVANMLTVSYHLREHRLKCHEYSYSPQLKRSLTMALKRCEEFINSFGDIVITKKLMKRYKKELKAHYIVMSARKDFTHKAEDFKECLPEVFLNDTSRITGFVYFQTKELHRAIKKHEKEYKKFEVWYSKFNDFLEKTVYI